MIYPGAELEGGGDGLVLRLLLDIYQERNGYNDTEIIGAGRRELITESVWCARHLERTPLRCQVRGEGLRLEFAAAQERRPLG